MPNGNCLCGAVTWKADRLRDRMTHCHCAMCRKTHGAPFATFVGAHLDEFAFLSGEDKIVRYESSALFNRAFCGQCGSAMPFKGGSGHMAVPAGCLDGDFGLRPTAHIFAAHQAPWHVIGGNLPRHDGYANPADNPDIEDTDLGARPEGTLRGSCLCGDIAFEITGEFDRVYSCHCSRCRKARAAAHTTNGFVSSDKFVFTRGAENLRSYKLPDAKIFTHVFCARCGSGMPRVDENRKVAVVPFGALDDDPGRGADCHVHVASKAEWYDIEDGLPQYEAFPP